MVEQLFGSSVGKKFLMAVTGLGLFLFVLGHLAGNLQVFLGAEAINRYGHFLQSTPELIWPARIGMIAMVGIHIWSAILLSRENAAARPEGYGEQRLTGASLASRTMLHTGLVVLVFIIYHLLHYTAEVRFLNGTGRDFSAFLDNEKRHDIFKMLVVGFNNPLVSGFYVLAIGLLCFHLSHGTSSLFQSLGLRNAAWRPVLDRGAQVVAVLIFLGYASIPTAILLGFGKEVLK